MLPGCRPHLTRCAHPGRQREGDNDIGFHIATTTRTGEKAAPVAFFSLEMSAEQLASRVIAEQTKISSDSIRKGNLTDEEYTRVAPDTPFIAPQFPGPLIIPRGTDTIDAMNIKEAHKRDMALYRECREVERALIRHITIAIEAKPIHCIMDDAIEEKDGWMDATSINMTVLKVARFLDPEFKPVQT